MKNENITEAEELVLSRLLCERAALSQVIELLHPKMFLDERNRIIYEHILKHNDNNIFCDTSILCQSLMASGEIQKVTFVYPTELMGKVASSINLEHHARMVVQNYFTRKVFGILNEATTKIATRQFDDINDIYNNVLNELNGMNEELTTGEMVPIKEVLPTCISDIYKRVENFGTQTLSGINTGTTKLNKATGGWKGGQLIILAARPAVGKTAFMLHFAKAAALSSDASVCIYSLEMDRESLTDRLIHSNTNINPDDFKSGKLTESDLREIERSVSQLEALKINFDDKSGCSLRYIANNAKLLHKKGKCDFVIVDYLQIMELQGDNENVEIGKITKAMKILARDLNIPVMVLSQLNRKLEDRPDKCPRMADLRSSGSIEQDADVICFLNRPSLYGIKTVDGENGEQIDTTGMVELIIGKQRAGSVGTIRLKHNPSITQITDFEPSAPISNFSIDNIQKF